MLKDRYLKYSPEITLEIFTLVFNKLIDSGWSYWLTPYTVDEIFRDFYNRGTLRDDGNKKLFAYINMPEEFTEITVQEILGYDPFVKEEVIPEYVECIYKSEGFTIGKIYKTNDTSSKDWYNFDSNDNGEDDGSFSKNFKSSTKEAFKAQNQPKPIEKWSVGSYIVIAKQVIGILLPTGTVRVIKGLNNNCLSVDGDILGIDRELKNEIKWFPTKSEAEEFAKTLFKPLENTIECEECSGTGQVMIAKLYPNGHTEVNETCSNCNGDGFKDKPSPVKQAVHCKNQEEWDYFISKAVDKSHPMAREPFRIDSAITFRNSWDKLEYFKKNGFEILSFQQWCDLNGYSVETESKAEFKVGDKVIGWHLPESDLNKIPWVIAKIHDNYAFPSGKPHWNTHINNITHVDSHKSPFKVGDWVAFSKNGVDEGVYELKTMVGVKNASRRSDEYRILTPEEINNHLISIGQIPAGDPINMGLMPDKDGRYRFTNKSAPKEAKKPILLLSIDDEELPMVSVIKTNSIKQLLNND